MVSLNRHDLIYLIKKHHQMYPKMELEDDYKLLHQAIFGPKHLLFSPSKERLLDYLNREIDDMMMDSSHEILEYIGNGFYRVYLNSITLKLVTKEDLIDAFYESMFIDLGSHDSLQNIMDESLLTLKKFHESSHFDVFSKDIKLKNYPAIHHSESYQKKYEPHYRVIHHSLLPLKLKENQKINILFLSDIHLKEADSIESKRLSCAIKHAVEMTSHLHAVCVVGDFTENGSDKEYDIFKEIISQSLPDETRLIVSVGNHENLRKESDSHQKFKDVFSYPVDYTFDVEGYTFVTLGTTKGETITNDQLTWLDLKLKNEVKKNPLKPIFFIHHYPAFKEVAYSVMGGQPVLFDLLSKYRNVIHISGHTHPDLIDERILSLEPFVSYNNGSLSWQIYRDELYVKKELRKASGQYSLMTMSGKEDIFISCYEINDKTNQSHPIRSAHIIGRYHWR